MKAPQNPRLTSLCILIMSQVALFNPLHANPITDSAQIVAAINNGSPGSTVEIGPGLFAIPASLKPKPGMMIRGAGAGQTILVPAATWSPSTIKLPDNETSSSTIEPTAYLFDLGSNDGVQLTDMSLRGSSRLHGAIYGDDADNAEFARLIVEDFLWSGIRTFRMNGATIHHCEFIDAGGRWKDGSPAIPGGGGTTGGSIFLTYVRDSEIGHNRFRKTLTTFERKVMGIKGRQGRGLRIHHNTVEIEDDFAIEFPFENDHSVEIDHNVFHDTVSVPKFGGGTVPLDGWSYRIHHNYFSKSFAIEWPRNWAEVDHNLFDFDLSDDNGNLLKSFGGADAQGPTLFHNNLVKNPGRGVFSAERVYNNAEFSNNHIIANSTVTPRTNALFGFPATNDFSTVVFRDNIIECYGVTRPLVNTASAFSAVIENNLLVGISDVGNYANPQSGAPRGLLAPLLFTCGVEGEFTVDGWDFLPTPGAINAAADAMVQSGASKSVNFGSDALLSVRKKQAGHQISYVRFDVGPQGQAATAQALLILTVASVGAESAIDREIRLRTVSTDTWEEDLVLWTNKPARGSTLALFSVNAGDVGNEIAIDVTAFFNAQRALDGQLSISLEQPSGSAQVNFASRESATPPRIEVTEN